MFKLSPENYINKDTAFHSNTKTKQFKNESGGTHFIHTAVTYLQSVEEMFCRCLCSQQPVSTNVWMFCMKKIYNLIFLGKKEIQNHIDGNQKKNLQLYTITTVYASSNKKMLILWKQIQKFVMSRLLFWCFTLHCLWNWCQLNRGKKWQCSQILVHLMAGSWWHQEAGLLHGMLGRQCSLTEQLCQMASRDRHCPDTSVDNIMMHTNTIRKIQSLAVCS